MRKTSSNVHYNFQKGYLSGGAGYVLSAAAVKAVVFHGFDKLCGHVNVSKSEDLELG